MIYHWSGSESNAFERLKTTKLAISIRDSEQSSRCDLEMVNEGSETEEIIGVSLFSTFYSDNILEYL